jgi:uncharacterized protein YndB with AHSA1/START domain
MTQQDLGTFIDRYTMRYERFYPHPVDRVWRALTSADALDAWMMPLNQVEARPGGKFSFSFGDPNDVGNPGSIGDFREEEVVDYVFENGSRMRFEIEAVEGGTKLAFIHSFTPQEEFAAMEGDPGGDLPGGKDTPWRPGFTAGFHLCLDNLRSYLDDPKAMNVDVQREALDRHHEGAHATDWLELIDVYRKHIKETIPA